LSFVPMIQCHGLDSRSFQGSSKSLNWVLRDREQEGGVLALKDEKVA
jgi:hypothetical protein